MGCLLQAHTLPRCCLRSKHFLSLSGCFYSFSGRLPQLQRRCAGNWVGCRPGRPCRHRGGTVVDGCKEGLGCQGAASLASTHDGAHGFQGNVDALCVPLARCWEGVTWCALQPTPHPRPTHAPPTPHPRPTHATPTPHPRHTLTLTPHPHAPPSRPTLTPHPHAPPSSPQPLPCNPIIVRSFPQSGSSGSREAAPSQYRVAPLPGPGRSAATPHTAAPTPQPQPAVGTRPSSSLQPSHHGAVGATGRSRSQATVPGQGASESAPASGAPAAVASGTGGPAARSPSPHGDRQGPAGEPLPAPRGSSLPQEQHVTVTVQVVQPESRRAGGGGRVAPLMEPLIQVRVWARP